MCVEHIDLRKSGRNVSVLTNCYQKQAQKRIKASACTVFLSTFLQLWLENTSWTIGRYISDISANLLNVFAMFIEWQDSMNFLGAAFLNLPKTFGFFQLISWLRLDTCWNIMEVVSPLRILYLCCSMREYKFLEVSPMYLPLQSAHSNSYITLLAHDLFYLSLGLFNIFFNVLGGLLENSIGMFWCSTYIGGCNVSRFF